MKRVLAVCCILVCVCALPVFAAEPEQTLDELFSAANEIIDNSLNGGNVDVLENTESAAESSVGAGESVAPDSVSDLTVDNLIVNNVIENIPYTVEPKDGVYPGRIPKDYLSMFSCLGNIADGYVVWRDGRDTYRCVVGDVTLSGNRISATGDMWVYNSDLGTMSAASRGTADIVSTSGCVYSSVTMPIMEREVMKCAAVLAFCACFGVIWCVLRAILRL